ncbi:AI-2E family transporter [Halobacteriales archaeon SW_7_65_23]|nr:MAG: AI-2E family transporter [Halobacteriales archaeon SW_7_65_23]
MDRSRAVVLGLAVILGVVSLLIVLPFLEYVLLAVLLAYVLRPLHGRLTPRTGEQVSAGILVLAATVAVVVPLTLAFWIVVQNVRTLVEGIREGEITFEGLESTIADLTGVEVDLMARLQSVIEGLQVGGLDSALSTLSLVSHVLIGLALTLFLLYYFLKDHQRLDRWLRGTVPIEDHIFEELRDEFDDVMSAVLYSHVLVAVVQGLVAGLGLLAIGVPEPVFWTIVMIFLALLPVIGSFLVWGPAAVWLVTSGRPVAGAFLFVYGAIVVGLTDDFLRPLFIERHSESPLNPAVIILGVIGGVYLLGFIGIFLGPVLLGLFRAVLDVYRDEFVQEGESRPPDEGPGTPSEETGVPDTGPGAPEGVEGAEGTGGSD